MQVLSALCSYLPHSLAGQLLADPTRSLASHGERFDAAVLFADMAGFTPLTEALGQVGPEGTEGLTRILNDLFTPMIEQIHRWGGVVGKFAGDAMTVLFRGTDASLRGLACALALQEQAVRSAQVETVAGPFTLQMKLGLAAGPVLQMVAGTTRRAEFIFAGRPLDDAAGAEHHASPGEIVLHPTLLERIPRDQIDGILLAEGYLRLQALKVEATPAPHPPLPATPDEQRAIEALRPFLPTQVYRRLLSGQEAFVNEHRRTTILFVGFEGIDYETPGAEALLGAYVAQVFDIVDRFAGHVCRVDMGDKGSKVLILFGAPVAHEDDEERALLCALSLQTLAEEEAAISDQRIGVNSGRVFVGNVGAPWRQEYTSMGDAVNLSARLMQRAAAGQVLVGENTHGPVADTFAWHPLPPLQVKGKAAPVTVFELTGRAAGRPLRLQELRYALPMVGRKEELAQLEAQLARVQETGRGQVVGLTAEAGMGKTRLAAELIREALGRGVVGYGSSGISHGTTTPYLAWRTLLRGLLELEEGLPQSDQVETIHRHLAEIDPDLPLRLPLLGPPLGLEIPDNELTAAFDADLRRQSLFALVADLIRHRAESELLLLVIEDAHWLDDLSRELTGYVARGVADLPVFLLTVYRPPEIEGQATLWASPPDHFVELVLGPFSSRESAELIQLKMAGRALPQALVEQIEQRAQGNPFFVDEFVNLLVEQGVNLDDPEALVSVEVPDSLQTLIISRLDQLAESEKMTIRVASVIGRLFRTRWLLPIYPGEIEETELLQNLDRLTTLELTVLDRQEPELEYFFKHALTQEVAYGSLSFANRRMLHERVGSYIEEAYGGDLGAWYGILVHHYQRAERPPKEYEYLGLAAQQAARQSAHRQAAAFYSRALALLDRLARGSDWTREQNHALLLGREEAYGMLGEREAQAADLARLSSLADQIGDDRLRSQVALRYAAYYEAVSDFPAALEAARDGAQRAEQADNLQYKVGGLIAGARSLWRQGAFEDAGQQLVEALTLAREHGDAPGEASSLHYMGTVLYFVGDYQGARDHLEQAMALRRSLSDRRGEAITLSNLAGVHTALGDFSQGQVFGERALAVYRAIGDRRHETQMLSNLGNIHHALGELAVARDHHQRALELFRVIGDRRGEALAAKNLGLVLHDLDDDEPARRFCEQALEINRATGDRGGEGYTLTYLGLSLEGLDQLEAASAAYEQALELRREIGQAARAIDDLAGLARVALKQGRLEQALPHVDEALAWIAEHGVDGIEYPLRVYLASFDVLTAAGQQERAAEVIAAAQALLQERAARISDEATRENFVERVPLHRQLRERASRPGQNI